MSFHIFAEVNGGITGYRCALVKASDRELMCFDDETIAEEKADELSKQMNGPHAHAQFRYTVVPA